MKTLEQRRDEVRALGVRTLGLFGSARRGDYHSESDLDFLVTLDCPTLRSYMALKELLEQLFGRPVDRVMADAIQPRIRERVLAEVVYVTGLSPVS
ncbi:MAG: nucleotidyltransferase family protein [Ktedonobacterales bacterium]